MKQQNTVKQKQVPRRSGQQSAQSSAGGIQKVENRNSFYNDGEKKLFFVALISIVCLVSSLLLVFYAANKTEKNVYFATDENGGLIQLVPLSQPNHSESVIADWLARALIDTFDFHFDNLERRINEASLKWFTPNGASELIDALDDSNNFESIRERQMFVNLALKHVPIVTRAGRPAWSKYYLWRLQVEGLMTYRTATDVFTNDVVFTVLVQRRSMKDDPTGLGIAKIIMTIK